MKKKEIESMLNAYNRLAKQAVEDKSIFGVTEIALRINDNDIAILKPFLRAEKETIYSVGDVELKQSGLVYSAELTEGDTKYLVFPNERVLYDTLHDLRQMIKHVAVNAKRVKADYFYEQTDCPWK